jgi:hypothetical protein
MDRSAPGMGMIAPLPLAAVALLVVNDHWLKAVAPGVLTGKLSDFAGLAFFPLFLQGAIEVAKRRASSRTLLIACAAATAIVFALVKTWAPAALVYRDGLGLLQWPARAAAAMLAGRAIPLPLPTTLTMDAGDLLALPAVVLAVLSGWSRRPSPSFPALEAPCVNASFP